MPRYRIVLEHHLERSPLGLHARECGDVSLIWAIDPPIIAGQDSPGPPPPDHRLIYLDGEVARLRGNRGSVRRIDIGTYRPLACIGRAACVAAAGSRNWWAKSSFGESGSETGV